MNMDNDLYSIVEPITQIDYEYPKYYNSVRPFPKGRIDYLTIILDDIRNYRALNKFQLSYISKLSTKHKQLIDETYISCMKTLSKEYVILQKMYNC